MRSLLQHASLVVCVALGIENAQSQESVLNVIPDDALAYVIVPNLTEASRSVDDLARLVQAPAPDLLGAASKQPGFESGVDEQRDAAVVLISVDPEPAGVLLAPVKDFAALCAAYGVEEPATGPVQFEFAGAPMLMGRKGDYAAFAAPRKRVAMEQFLASTTSLAADAELAEWLDANQASFVVTPRGIKQLLPKLTNGIRATQEQIRAVAGANGQAAAAGLDLYAELFAAAETEVEQFRLGVRVDSAQTVQLIKLVQFTPGGHWAALAGRAETPDADLLARFPAEPFIVAVAGALPAGSLDGLMRFSVKMMQDQPGFELTPEQAEEYLQLSNAIVRSVHSMGMVLGVPQPGAGLYGNTSAVMIVDDSRGFLEEYEKSLAALSRLAQEAKSAIIPKATIQRVPLGDSEALEVTMDVADLPKITTPGGPDLQTMMQAMFGPSKHVKVYLAPADEHAVLFSYTSLEQLQAALDVYRSGQGGLANDPGVAQVAAALPEGSQFVAYISLNGVAAVVPQFARAFPGSNVSAMPEFPDCPPIGIAAKAGAGGVEGRLVVTAETLRAIGDAVAGAAR